MQSENTLASSIADVATVPIGIYPDDSAVGVLRGGAERCFPNGAIDIAYCDRLPR
ncbi:hypothetical protein JHU04_004138 [Brenneria sp. 4F2]|nr:hypothetical protein [Brenneria bubanii]